MIWQSEWQWQIIHFLGLSLSAMMEAQFLRIRFGPKLYHAIKSFITWLTFFITWKKPVKYDNLLCHFQHTKCDTIRVSVSWNLSKYSLFSFPTNIWISNSDYSTWFLSSKCFNMTWHHLMGYWTSLSLNVIVFIAQYFENSKVGRNGN